MKFKQLLFLVIALLAMKGFSQEINETLKGKIISSGRHVANVHIVNLNQNTGTVTDDNGFFSIELKEGEYVLISSLQYETKRIQINKDDLLKDPFVITLIPAVNILDEVRIHGLTGNLKVDFFKVPEDDSPKHNFKLSPSDYSKILPENNSVEPPIPDARKLTDPIQMNAGIGISIGGGKLASQRALRAHLAKKKLFPEKLIKHFGKDFFILDLKIPEDNIYQFITFCENKNIMQLFEQENWLKLVQVLITSSKLYHKIDG